MITCKAIVVFAEHLQKFVANSADTRLRNMSRKPVSDVLFVTCASFFWCKFFVANRMQLYSPPVCTRTFVNFHQKVSDARHLRKFVVQVFCTSFFSVHVTVGRRIQAPNRLRGGSRRRLFFSQLDGICFLVAQYRLVGSRLIIKSLAFILKHQKTTPEIHQWFIV